MVQKVPQNPEDWPDDFYENPISDADQAALDELAEAALIDRIDGNPEEVAEEERDRARHAILRALSHHLPELQTENGSDVHPFTQELDEFHGLAEQLMTRYEITIEELRQHVPQVKPSIPKLGSSQWRPEWN